ncbi:putative aspartic proteinase GIP2 [Wolffia australiana]
MPHYEWRCRLASLALLFLLFVSGAGAQRPKTLAVVISKDKAMLQYVAHLRQRIPLVSVSAMVDLGSSFFWVDCNRGFVSSSSKLVRCNSAQCAIAGSGAYINGTSCSFFPNNPFIRTSSIGEVTEDVVVVSSTNRSKLGPPVFAARTIFGYGSTGLLRGLAQGAKGIVVLGRNPVTLPSQLAAKFSLHRCFAICLSCTFGGVFFGDGPYCLHFAIDASFLTYAPLLVNLSFSRQQPSEYFIGVTSIQVNRKRVAGFNAELLTINKKTGQGGMRISTVEPYTVLESSIFRAVASAFAKEGGLRLFTSKYASASVCAQHSRLCHLSSRSVSASTPARFWGVGNSVVEVRAGVSCLAFVDDGPDVTSAIVIGRLGLSGSLSFYRLACSEFNFTVTLIFQPWISSAFYPFLFLGRPFISCVNGVCMFVPENMGPFWNFRTRS